jgi:hypothetical protein
VIAPDGSNFLQQLLIFENFAAKHPDVLHRPAVDVFLASLIEAWPCKTGAGG